MSEYIRRPGDRAFRRVSLMNSGLPRLEAFTTENQLVKYPAPSNWAVLEVVHEDGSSEICFERDEPVEIQYGFIGDTLWIKCPGNVSLDDPGTLTARLWLREIDGTGIDYKIPVGLEMSKDDRKLKVRVPGAGRNPVELFGDPYFNRAFVLKRI